MFSLHQYEFQAMFILLTGIERVKNIDKFEAVFIILTGIERVKNIF